MKIFNLNQIFYIALLLLAFFASNIDAQNSEVIEVSISYDGPAEIDESVVLSRQDNDATGEIRYSFGNPLPINFRVSLSRALTAGERVKVPLEILGNISTDDIETIDNGKIARDTTAINTGVLLTNDGMLTSTVTFQDGGAQFADLKITVRNDNVLELDETMTIAIAEGLNGNRRLSIVKGSSSSTKVITIIDDEYNINFANANNPPLQVGENVGSIEIPLTIARGRAGNEGLLRETGIQFRYPDALSATPGKDFTEIFSQNTTPSFVRLSTGTTAYTLTVPIVNDTEPEPNELLIIHIEHPRRYDDQSVRKVERIINGNDFIYASVTAEQEKIDEGDIAEFSVAVATLSRNSEHAIPENINLKVSNFPGGNFIPQAFEDETHIVELDFLPEFRRTDNRGGDGGEPYYTTATATFAVPTAQNDLIDTEHRIRAEIIPSSDYELAISSATVTVRNDDPQAAIAAVRTIHKGDDIMLTITLNSPREENITIPINITEVEQTAGKDFIAASAEGRKEIIFSAGEISKTHTISTAVLDNGNRSVAGRVTVSLVPSPDYAYAIASPASVSIDIIDIVCGHVLDVDTDDDGLIEICDLEDLDAMRQQLDGSGYRASRTAPLFNAGCDEDGDQGGVCRGYELTRSLDFESPGSYLSGSINREWTEGLGWQPIGESLRAFSGHFEANGFAITNLYINRPVDNVGLIRNTAPSALINNLILLQADIRGQSQVGALVAVNEGIVSNINLISSTLVGLGDTIGGLIGTNKGTVFKNNVRNVTLTGGITELRCASDLTSTNCADAEKSLIVLARGNNVGGLIGNNEGELSNNFASVEQVLGRSRVGGLVGTHSGITFNNNEAGGSVRGSEYAGGLVGYSIGAIADSKSIADVSVRAGGSYAGGLVGYGEGDINDSEADGAEVSGGTYVGGLVGYGVGDISDSEADDTEVSGDRYVGGLAGYGEGDINDSEAGDTEVSGSTHVGGLVGYGEGDINDSEADDTEVEGSTYVGGLAGTIEAGIVIRSNASGAVQGSSEVGGLVGSIEAGEIAESYASGAVTGTAQNIGGLVGTAFSTTITVAYATGVVTGDNSTDPEVENDVDNVGGLVGSIEAGEIAESYASGAVRGSSEVGGLVGSIEAGEIAGSYANGNVTGTAQNIGGLVGTAFSTTITVAYATGVVTGDNSTDPEVENDVDNVGGLVGKAESAVITKGYALNPSVRGVDKVGGLIGIKSGGTVENSYTRNSLQGVNRVGGLIGENNGTVGFAYAASAVSASGTDAGGLIGYDHASRSRIIANREVQNSYWDITVSGINVSIAGDAGTGFSTSELQTPTAPGATVSEAFYQWNNADWDFGTATDYPILKDSEAQILPQQTIVLSNLIVEDSLTLVPAFDPNVFDYYIEVPSNQSQISLTITATDDDAIVSISSSANNNAPTIRGSDTVAIALNANPAATEIIIARSYRVQAIYPLAITISADPADKQVNEGQTARFTVAANAAGAIPLSYTWTQSNPTTPLLIEGIGTGITVQDPNFSIPIAADLVLPSATGLPIALDVKVTGAITGSPTTQSVTLTAIKVNDGIGSVALAAPELVAGTTLLQVSNIAGAIAADPDGEAADADKNIRYQWQSAQHDETTWSDIANANSASFDISPHDLGHFQYRLRMHYIDAQGYEESLSSAATAIVDKDQDGLIELYHLEDLNAIRHSLAGESYISSSNATALTGGCPNAICRGYELYRDLDFNDAASYASGRVNSDWTVADFNDASDTGWLPLGEDLDRFNAVFDGNGHTLSNLQSNRNIVDVGLFGITRDAVVRNLNLSNVKMEGLDRVGGLIGTVGSRTRIIGVSVSGEITATNGRAGGIIGRAGELMGSSIGILIANSQANVHARSNNTETTDFFDHAGGLIGHSRDTIILNSYATGTMEGDAHVGGLVGRIESTRIYNCYADADVIDNQISGFVLRNDVGGLIGQMNSDSSLVADSYAAGSVSGLGVNANEVASGLIGRIIGGGVRNSYSIANVEPPSDHTYGLTTQYSSPIDIIASYWDTIASGQLSSDGGIGKLTGQMQAGTAQSEDPNGIYYNWSETAWDFGAATQYPALKYIQHPDHPNAEPVCDAEGLPKCGTLLTPHLIYGLKDLSLMGAELSPPFSGRDYTGRAEAAASVNAIRLLPTAYEPNVLIDIYDSDGKTLLQADLASGTPSQEFTFNAEMPTRHFIIEIKGTETVRLSITLNRVEFIEINYLEDLNAIRDNLGSSYRLVRDLNFNDPTSYESGNVNPDWTVADFDSASDTGWEPIGTQSDPFTGIFDGNGYTIANLQINRDSASYVGLFGSADASSLIHDISLRNVEIEGGSQTGGLVGNANGEIRNNYTTGKLRGGNNSGGLAGQSAGNIANSFSSVNVTGRSSNFIGGLVGRMTAGAITNSLARGTVSGGNSSVGGLVGGNGSGTITNSAASGDVEGGNLVGSNLVGGNLVGGLVGENKGQVRNSNAKGSVTAGGSDIGGLVGRNTGTSAEIDNSYATGAVEGNSWVGGLTGSNEGEVTKSFASGDVKGTSGRIGGLVAQNSSNGEITDSYASGDVEGGNMVDDNLVGGNLVGGLVGDNAGKVEDSNARGSVTAAGGNIGGLVGRNEGTNAQITDSYASGDVKGGNSDLVGGLVGDNAGKVEGSNARGSVTEGGGDIGGLVGRNTGTDAQITDSYATGDVEGGNLVGGLVGENFGKVEGSNARGSVTATGSNIGGLVGKNNGTDAQITDSYARGAVTGENSERIGGLVGANDGEITDSYARGAVTGTNSGRIGGLAGYNNSGTITNSFAVGLVEGGNWVGGLVGYNNSGTITNSSAGGTVSGVDQVGGLVGENDNSGVIIGSVAAASATVSGANNVGGLVGRNTAEVINSSARGSVTATASNSGGLVGRNAGTNALIINSHASGNVVGTSYIGGLTSRNKGKIINSWATGTVRGTGVRIGGLVGEHLSGEIQNCYSEGAVSSNGSTNIVDEKSTPDEMGGLVGYVANNAEVANCYTISNVSNLSDSGVGALIGRHQGSAANIARDVTNSYWNTDITGRDRSSSGGTGVVTTILQIGDDVGARIYQRWSPNNWNFRPISQYPKLKYAVNTGGTASCGGTGLPNCGCGGTDLPNCGSNSGSNISPPVADHSKLNTEEVETEVEIEAEAEVELEVIGATLNPAFDSNKSNYIGTVTNAVHGGRNSIQLRVTAPRLNDRIDIYVGSDEAPLSRDLTSGEISKDITLVFGGNLIIIEIKPTNSDEMPLRYELNLIRQDPVRIEYLEDLNAIRNNLSGNYQLVRDLDFSSAGSYRDPGTNRPKWSKSTTGPGWVPIGEPDSIDETNGAMCNGEADSNCFTGNFNGNGYTISNLKMDTSRRFGGLFGAAEGGVIGNLGLVDVDLNDQHDITVVLGGVVGYYQNGKLYNSHVTGGNSRFNAIRLIRPKDSGDVLIGPNDIGGGLVGAGRDISIINSYVDITMGGLTGAGLVYRLRGSNNEIINSYADMSSALTSNSGGLVGSADTVHIRNSYVEGYIWPGSNSGGLIYQIASGTIRNSYVAGFFAGSSSDSFIYSGTDSTSVVNSYWDMDLNPDPDDYAVGKTTAELQSPTGATGIYSGWSEDDWAFGTDEQYPILKYTDASETLGFAACGTADTPPCGSIISPGIHNRLIGLTLSGEDSLDPPFDVNEQEYIGIVNDKDSNRAIRVIPTAANASDDITVHIGDDETQQGDMFDSGTLSPLIILDSDGTQKVTIKIIPQGSSESATEYTLYLQLQINDINYLEDLDKIRDNLSSDYRLTRHLDFTDPGSYRSGTVNTDWLVNRAVEPEERLGWTPIGHAYAEHFAVNCTDSRSQCFSGAFYGNGYTIANLQMAVNLSQNSFYGLFGGIDSDAVVRDLGLLNVKMEKQYSGIFHDSISGLVGFNDGTIIGSYATGIADVSGNSTAGGLVGINTGEVINSHAGVISQGNAAFGALVARNGNSILNSYASSIITGTDRASGLIGDIIYLDGEIEAGAIIRNSFAESNIRSANGIAVGGVFALNDVAVENSYAAGAITVLSQNSNRNDGVSGIGGLGAVSSKNINNSYTISTMQVADLRAVGRIVGRLVGSRNNRISLISSYFNSDKVSESLITPDRSIGAISSEASVSNSFSQTTAQLKSGTAQSTASSTVYYQWSEEDWDFGTSDEYPILKYAQNPNEDSFRACGALDLPNCGDLIAPQIRYGLSDLTLAGNELSPRFNDPARENFSNYLGAVVNFNEDRSIQLIPTAKERSAMINIYINTVKGKGTPDQSIASGATSAPITLAEGVNRIVLEIVSTQTVQYPLYIQSQNPDRDGNGFAEIDNLEDLNAIRNNLSGNYELTRHLDFNDANSYALGVVNTDWTVDDFDDSNDTGWTPIGTDSSSFTGQLNGNGFTISNLQINRNRGGQGLFAFIAGSGIVRDLGLLNVEIESDIPNSIIDETDLGIGAFAARSNGTLMGSYMVGNIRTNSVTGGLVGRLNQDLTGSGQILNSHAIGSVSGIGTGAVGGLVGNALGDLNNVVRIVNSYADVISNGGGVAGTCGSCTIYNSYAVGEAKGDNGAGFVTRYLSGIDIRNNYAHGDAKGGGGFFNLVGEQAGGLIGSNYSIGRTAGHFNSSGVTNNFSTSALPNYWNSDTADDNDAAVLNASGKTTEELQMPTAPGTTLTEVYYGWSEDNWDFGTSDEYPILKYTANPGGEQTCDGEGLPNCGDLIAPQIRFGLQNLTLADDVALTPPFGAVHRNLNGSYSGAVRIDTNRIRLIPTAQENDAMINIYISTVTGKDPDQSIASGTTSSEIALSNKGINRIVLEIVGTQTVQYPLYIERTSDRDNNGFAEIDNLEDLNAIRDNLSGNYELTRHLDFNDPNSYALGVVNTDWTVDDFDDSNDTGWVPIGVPGLYNRQVIGSRFTGKLNGNGFTISNLQINRNRGGQGLFSFIDGSGIVRDLGLLNVEIESDIAATLFDEIASGIGAFAALSRGTLMASYMVGNIRTNAIAGGLVGVLTGSGQILNSYAIGSVSGRDTAAVGGLAGSVAIEGVDAGSIVNSYADVISNGGGVAGTCGSCTIYNSFAVGEGKGVRGAGFVYRLQGTDVDIRNNYAYGDAKIGGGFFNLIANRADGLIGSNYSIGRTAGRFINSGSISRSVSGAPNYWNSDTADGNAPVSNASGKTTEELQMPTTASGIYSEWRTANWDFGTSDEYPILKYTANPGGEQTCDGEGLPNCGDLIAPQIRFGLQNLTLAGGVALTPPFDAAHRNLNGSYSGTVSAFSNRIRLIPTAKENDATINIYISTVTGKAPEQSIASGMTSSEIALSNKGITRIVLEIVGTQTVQYPLYLQYEETSLDMIDSLEDLNAIRNNLSGNYELTRHLDFATTQSYASGIVNTDWTVDDFDDSNDTGWTPIGTDSNRFTGQFNGNGFTISKLQINRTAEDQGLFAAIGSDGSVRDLGLLNVKIMKAGTRSGALAGINAGTVIGSHATGEIDGAGNNMGGLIGQSVNGQVINSYANVMVGSSGNNIGGLVGGNTGANARIVNSYATGDVEGNSLFGGLTGLNEGKVINSYAMGDVTGRGSPAYVGALVGQNSLVMPNSNEVRNSYAAGTVSSNVNGSRSGGLIGYMENGTKLINSYTISSNMSAPRTIGSGSLVGWHETGDTNANDIASDIKNSYWDNVRNAVYNNKSSGNNGQPTAELQAPTAATGIYSQWSTANWDFGTSDEYPILKYTQNSDGERSCDGEGLPNCGDLIAPQIRFGLQNLTLAGYITLNPPFGAAHRNLNGSYSGTVSFPTNRIRLIPTAKENDAMINIYISTVTGEAPDQSIASIASGATSAPIELSNGINYIVLEIVGTQTVQYPLYIQYDAISLAPGADIDNDGFIDINDLEDLNAIRDNLSGNYELTRHLDFNDNASYSDSSTNKPLWTVDDFADANDTGWTPIGTNSSRFTGQFNGNGFTISKLQINRTAGDQGLFGVIGISGIVRDLGLLNVKMEAGLNSGALIGRNAGTVIGSHATGEIDGTANNMGGLIGQSFHGQVINSYANVMVDSSESDIGGLVGRNTGANARIINSYARGRVVGNRWVGGLTASNDGRVINSYATGDVTGSSNRDDANVGALVGQNSNEVINSYAAGIVSFSGTIPDRSGGLIGYMRNNTKLINSYTISNVEIQAGSGSVGALVGWHEDGNNANAVARDITHSYWDSDRNIAGHNNSSSGDNGQTTMQLQAPTAPGTIPTEVYYDWSEDNWDFGTAQTYPILKYTQNPAGQRSCDGEGLPNCGDLIAPQIRFGLQNLTLAGDATLDPPFGTVHRNLNGSYSGTVSAFSNRIRLIPTAQENDAMINIYISTVTGKAPDQSIASGTTSSEIALSDKGINRIVLEIVGTQTVQYPLYLQYAIPLNMTDIDGDGFIDISNLEDLIAIRNDLSGNYELTRHLDFNDASSYASGIVNTDWTVDDFADANDTGWTPIGTDSSHFTGQFNGNGFTISKLQINRTAAYQGLFAAIGTNGSVRDLGLLNVKMEAGLNSGALAGRNAGTVIGSHATGEIDGTGNNMGGLIGQSVNGQVINSYANVMVRSSGDYIGGLVGRNAEANARIVNSYARGRVVGNSLVGGLTGGNFGKVINSYATGDVTGSGNEVGALVGENSNEVINSYAAGIVLSSGTNPDQFGGLIGFMKNNTKLTNSYAISNVATPKGGGRGALVGWHQDGNNASAVARDITHSYWDSDRNIAGHNNIPSGNNGKTTMQLQAPTAPGTIPTEVYYDWSEDNWDFGTSDEYPILKYAANPDGQRSCDGEGLPNCGDLIAPQIRFGLQNLTLAGDVTLNPPFGAAHRNLNGSYSGTVFASTNRIRLIPTAMQSTATINIYISTVTGKAPDQSIASGTTSSEIALSDKGINRIVLEIVGTQTVQYPLYIQYDAMPLNITDIDGDGFIEINDLEDLIAIRNNLSGNYELTRHLDFNDPNSYVSTANKVVWTVDNFADTNDTGWTPIGTDSSRFIGQFNGNGFTISKLQINRTADNQGLFGFIAASGVVRDLGLLNVKMEAGL